MGDSSLESQVELTDLLTLNLRYSNRGPIF